MSVIATAVKHMMAAGMPSDVILAAIAEMEADIRQEPKPRSSAAVRQERYRRNKASRVTDCDASDAAPSLSRPLPSPQTPLPTPTHTHPDNNTRARKGLACPDGVSPAVFRDAVAHRQAMKKPLTETALLGIEREAGMAGWSLEAALVEMVSRGWQGFKAAWVEGSANPSNAPAKLANPDAGRNFARYQAGEISFEEFDKARTEATGPPRSIGQIVGAMSG